MLRWAITAYSVVRATGFDTANLLAEG